MIVERADALALDLDTRAGLCIARILGGAGLTVAVASRDGSASGLTTRFACDRFVLPDPAVDFDAHVDALVAALEARPSDATIATIDSSLEALHRNRTRIERLTAPALGSFEAVEVALSKERTLALATTLGIPTPRSVTVTSADETIAAATDMGFPCVLKPVSSWRDIGDGGERVAPVIVASAEDAGRVGSDLVRPDAPGLVQEFATGDRETIKLFRSGGNTIARFAMIVDRCWPPLGGSSTMRRVVTPPEDSVRHAERLVSEIGLDGYSEVEFRRNAHGLPLLMEINPRLSQSVEVATRAGFDFPRMQLEWARGGRIPAAPSHTPVGLRVGWLGGDLRLLLGALGGAPAPRPKLVPTVTAIARDYLLRRARLEGLDVYDRKPIVRAFALPVTGRRRARPSG